MLWDIDYTLIGASGVGQRLYREVFQEMFGRDLPGFAPMAGRTDRAIIRDTLGRAGIPEPGRHLNQFIARLAELAPTGRELAAERSRALPGAAAALAALARYAPGTADGHGPPPLCVVQSVLTGNVRQIAELKLAAAGLAGFLDLGVGAYGDAHEVRADLVHVARENAARRYGVAFDGEATVLVGDTELDVAAALATGARVVGVASGGTPAGDLAAAGASAVLADLTDTPATLAAILADSDTETPLSTARAFPNRPSTARFAPVAPKPRQPQGFRGAPSPSDPMPAPARPPARRNSPLAGGVRGDERPHHRPSITQRPMASAPPGCVRHLHGPPISDGYALGRCPARRSRRGAKLPDRRRTGRSHRQAGRVRPRDGRSGATGRSDRPGCPTDT